jgi:hypothetical protein
VAATSDQEALRLPWEGEFTPGQLGEHALDEALNLVEASSGDPERVVEAIRQRWFAGAAQARSDPAERLQQQRTRARNVVNGMQNYGLVSRAYTLTDIGTELRSALRQCFREKTREAMHLKRAQVMDTLDDLSEDES